MSIVRRIALGALGGTGATVVLTGLRKGLAFVGVIGDTVPEQIVDRLDRLGALEGWSGGARRALAVTAHVLYGASAGAAFGLLRRERGRPSDEAAVGAALGLLSWGAGWAAWLPLAGVHSPPWKQNTPKVLLPVVDHAVFGAAWGLLYRVLSRRGV